MEAMKPLMKLCIAKLKQGTLLWLEGFKEACYLHRVVILCLRSRKLLIRTGQCFLLNGFIFLGSMIVLNSVVIPMLFWILPDQCSRISTQVPCSFGGILKLYSVLRLGLIQLFYVFWFYPLYMFSLILSSLWYNDIAKFGFAAMGRSRSAVVEPSSPSETLTAQSTAHTERLAGLGGVMVGIGEQVYSVLLLSFFFLEVFATGFIPYVGKAINFLLLSWMYAYYCFEYKWNFSEVALDKRLDYFESNWAFFAGFGSPCVLAIFFVSPLVSYGIMAVLFPLALSRIFLFQEENGEVLDWEGFQYFTQLTVCRCGCCLSCLWNLKTKLKKLRHIKNFWPNAKTIYEQKIVNQSQEETLVEACSDADANCSSNLRIEGEKTNQNAQ